MRRGSGLSIVLAAAVAACGVLRGTSSDDPPADGGSDATVGPSDGSADAPATGFQLTVDPPHITGDVGDQYTVTVHVARAPSFTDIVSLSLGGEPLGVRVSMPGAAVGDSSTFTIAFDAAVPDFDLTVVGMGVALQGSAVLGVHVGSEIVADADGFFVVPKFADTGIDVKLWGGGGGGAFGGAGGFASARLLGVAGEKLQAVVGMPGTGYMGTGGGGGFSGIARPPSTWLLIAGGGGGGAGSATSGYLMGGGGGGDAGGTGEGPTGGTGGTLTGGGAGGAGGAGGGALDGGNGAANSPGGQAGGVPGGGMSGFVGYDPNTNPVFAGGGGGGWFGGGGGGASVSPVAGSAGGGGSGFASNAAVDASLVGADGWIPAATNDPDYSADAGTARPYRPGRIVVRLPKPH